MTGATSFNYGVSASLLLDISQGYGGLQIEQERSLLVQYHVVFCRKYRKPVLNPPIDAKLKKLIQQVCGETQSALIEMEVMPDHVHLLVGCDPQYGIHRLVKGIKGRSSRVLRQQFRVLRTRIPTLWTNSYFVSSIGGTPLALIKQH